LFRFIVVALLSAVLFASPFSHNLKWKSYQTKHFNIYFSDDTQASADKAFEMVEDIYSKVSREIHFSPPDRIDLVFADQTDVLNGYADYFRNTIVIEASPIPDSVFGPFHDDALKTIIVHELTHIIHLGMTYSNGLVYSFLKRLTSKGFMYPYFIAEGYAVYNEKRIGKGGRLYNSNYKEHLMAFSKYDNFPSLNQITYASMLRFPQGDGPYILGAEFVDYLCKRYGKRQLVTAFHYFSRKQYISSFEMAFEKIYDKSLETAYQEFIDHVKLSMINGSQVESEYELLVTGNVRVSKPTWMNPDQVMYYLNDMKEDPKLILYTISTAKASIIFQDPSIVDKYQLLNKDLFYLKFDQDDLYSSSHKLYKYNLETRRNELLARGIVDFYRSEDAMIYIKEKQSQHILYYEDLKSEVSTRIVSADNIGSIILANDSIYYVKRLSTMNALYKYSIQTKNERLLLSGNIRDMLVYKNDLYLVADWEGLSQLYKYTSTGNVEKMAHLITGMYSPSILNKELIFVTYTDMGASLAYLDNIEKSMVSSNYKYVPIQVDEIESQNAIAVSALISINIEEERVPSAGIYNFVTEKKYPKIAKDYSIWGLNAHYFVPWIAISNYGSSLGILTMISDPLLYQQFSARFQYNLGYESYIFSYLNTAVYPYIQLQAVREGLDGYVQEMLLFPFLLGRHYHQLDLGLEQRSDDDVTTDYYYTSYQWSTLKRYQHSISYEQGFQNSFSVKTRQSDYKKTIVEALSLYLPGIGKNHVLYVDMSVGKSAVGKFAVGGYPRSLSVRGYDYATEQQGSRFARLSLEYRFPFLLVDDYLLMGYYVPQLDCSLFIDVADAQGSFSSLFKSNDELKSFGFLINMKGVQFNSYLFEFGIGLASSTEKNTCIIFSFGTNFSI